MTNNNKIDDSVSQTVNDALKTILKFMQHFSKAIEKISLDLSSLEKRISKLEYNDLPKPPQIKIQTENHPRISDNSNKLYSHPQPELQSEIVSKLKSGIKLKPVEQAKREELHNLHEAVHSEFKRVKYLPKMEENSFEEKTINILKKQLTTDIENALVQIQQKLGNN